MFTLYFLVFDFFVYDFSECKGLLSFACIISLSICACPD